MASTDGEHGAMSIARAGLEVAAGSWALGSPNMMVGGWLRLGTGTQKAGDLLHRVKLFFILVDVRRVFGLRTGTGVVDEGMRARCTFGVGFIQPHTGC